MPSTNVPTYQPTYLPTYLHTYIHTAAELDEGPAQERGPGGLVAYWPSTGPSAALDHASAVCARPGRGGHRCCDNILTGKLPERPL